VSNTFRRAVLLVIVTLVAAGCGSNSKSGGTSTRSTAPVQKIDYKAIGLWDDGPCDPAKPPLKLGLSTVFESPVLSLKEQATALDASAKAFNARGGANGSCIQVTTCDDGANTDQALGCVRTLDSAGVVATVNDTTTSGSAEVAAAMAKAKIARVAPNLSNEDWADPNAYPLDASSTGVVLILPEALIKDGITKIGVIRVNLAAASALTGILKQIYVDDGATFPYDAPVAAGTTDYSQFLLGADQAGTGGVVLALGEQEAVQVVKSGQQVGTQQVLGSALGSFSHKFVSDLGSFAKQMVFAWSFPPATADLPVYQALRADLAASGDDALQPENLKSSPMHSWIGLYALLRAIRDAKLTTFTRSSITSLLQHAKNVPMLHMFGDENWTPNLNHPGVFKRAGMNHWATYKWDPKVDSAGFHGSFVEQHVLNWDQVLCGSPIGGPPPCS
jgi:ABC-type branched-subunit amino acid transport system substrate-binding protein